MFFHKIKKFQASKVFAIHFKLKLIEIEWKIFKIKKIFRSLPSSREYC